MNFMRSALLHPCGTRGIDARTHSRTAGADMRIDLSGLKFVIVAGPNLAAADLAESIERRGGKAVTAPNCAAAFEALEQNKPDFAVLDFHLSDCDAVAAELNSLAIPHIYLGTPLKRERASIRSHFSTAFADAMVMLVNNDETYV